MPVPISISFSLIVSRSQRPQFHRGLRDHPIEQCQQFDGQPALGFQANELQTVEKIVDDVVDGRHGGLEDAQPLTLDFGIQPPHFRFRLLALGDIPGDCGGPDDVPVRIRNRGDGQRNVDARTVSSHALGLERVDALAHAHPLKASQVAR
jgi:hypothetical protein